MWLVEVADLNPVSEILLAFAINDEVNEEKLTAMPELVNPGVGKCTDQDRAPLGDCGEEVGALNSRGVTDATAGRSSAKRPPRVRRS